MPDRIAPSHREPMPARDQHFGKYLGYVVDDKDPESRGRLRLRVPEVLGDQTVSGWADACFPIIGPNQTFVIPAAETDRRGDYTTEVWVEFRGGDPRLPIWVGGACVGKGARVPELSLQADLIKLNGGTQGAARLGDKVRSTAAEDKEFWRWVDTLMSWLATHTHIAPEIGPTTPPLVPYPGLVPSACVGKIIESSATVIVGD